MRLTSYAVLALLPFVLALAGCGTKVSKVDQQEIQVHAVAAKERAVAFAPISEQLRAKASTDQNGVARFAGKHSERLATRAKTLDDLYQAVQLGGLNQTTIEQIGSMAETAAAGAENFRQIALLIDWNWPEFVATHQSALDLEARWLADLYQRLKPKTKVKPPAAAPAS